MTERSGEWWLENLTPLEAQSLYQRIGRLSLTHPHLKVATPTIMLKLIHMAPSPFVSVDELIADEQASEARRRTDFGETGK